MERPSTNNNSSNGNMSSSFGNLPNSTLVQLDATILSSVESQLLSSNNPTSFREMLEDNYDTNYGIDLNLPYAPPISSSNSPAGIYDRSFLTVPHCTNCGQKRKAPDGSSEDDEGSHGNTGDCQCQVTPVNDGSSQSTNLNGPPISQRSSTLGGDTSGDGSSNLLTCPAHSYRNVQSRRRLHESVRRSLPPSNDPHSATAFTFWNARTSVNREGVVIHNMQAPRRTMISSQPGIRDGSPNSSNPIALMTEAQHTGTTSNQRISPLRHTIHRPIHPFYNTIIGSNVAVQQDGGPIGMNFGSVNEGNGGVIYNTNIGADSDIFLQRVRANIWRRELIAQALRANNAPVPLANDPLAASSRRAGHPGLGLPPQLHQAFPGYTRQVLHLALASSIQGHLTGHAQFQGQVTDIHGRDDRQNNLMMNLEAMAYQEITNFLNEIRVNTPLSEADILQGLAARRWIPSRTNDEEEQEICCICLDELGNGQDLVKLDCGHKYHFECIKLWLGEKNCCAICKRFAIAD